VAALTRKTGKCGSARTGGPHSCGMSSHQEALLVCLASWAQLSELALLLELVRLPPVVALLAASLQTRKAPSGHSAAAGPRIGTPLAADAIVQMMVLQLQRLGIVALLVPIHAALLVEASSLAAAALPWPRALLLLQLGVMATASTAAPVPLAALAIQPAATQVAAADAVAEAASEASAQAAVEQPIVTVAVVIAPAG